MRVLVIGSGGREHALCWALSASSLLTELWCAPGNPGIAKLAKCADVGPMDIPALVAFAKSAAIDLVVPGPEGPLVGGIVDAMTTAGIACFGPTKAATALESSKRFGKDICDAAGIETASWASFDDPRAAEAYVRKHGAPIVVKADGLCSGKGVVVAMTEDEALDAIYRLMVERSHGDAGATVVIEECLVGRELSFFALCDGTTAIPLGTARDHKRLLDGDRGPNTGGMGAYSAPADENLQRLVMTTIVQPALDAMAERGTPFSGVLFCGLMLTLDGIRLLEFNVRFGDPECQALMLRIDFDLLDALWSAVTGTLDRYTAMVLDGDEITGSDSTLRWKRDASVAVVMATPGYPDAPQWGSAIEGLHCLPDVEVFHSGTEIDRHGTLRAVAGRVLTVCATGETIPEARMAVYGAIPQINWPEAQYRKDIGIQAGRC